MKVQHIKSKFDAMGARLKVREIASRGQRVLMNTETQSRTMANVAFLD